MVLESKAYAKVNLHLEVLNKRSDGYHNIFSVMASIGLYDLLKLDSLDVYNGSGDPVVDIVAAGGGCVEFARTIEVKDNLVYKAFRGYFDGAAKSCSAVVSLWKNIPPGAGLGGGSSDAAAMLRLLNEKLGWYTDEELAAIGSEVGSDVPYCISGGLAICEGRGEVITPLQAALKAFVVVVNDGIHVDTGKAYAIMNRDAFHCDNEDDRKIHRIAIQNAIEKSDFDSIRTLFRNDFESPVFRENPAIYDVKKRVLQCNPDFAAMTGSGSTIIAVFEDYNRANDAMCVLRDEFRHVALAEFI
ncbi:MAG TPA: 4-(cytidine 5'-diphospho)-2-C-methyl-D-erythritol kinase [Spirochaetota bacterium]|nr:4-(cytidine 5'-diphospho)-2-C-methyl-D-erythritol kinase [Spirochaetota bacterium]